MDNEHCFQKRKSVIVDNCSPNTSHKCENFEEQVKKVKLDIDIPAITRICRDIFIQEERNYIQNIKYTFETAWDKVSLGEKFMKDYINVCQTKKDFTSDFFLSTGKQLR